MASSNLKKSQMAAIFENFKIEDAAIRLEAAKDLRRYISEQAVAEMSSDAVGKLWDDTLNHMLFNLIYSQNSAEVYGGLAAISQLLDVGEEAHVDLKRELFRFWGYVKHLFPNNDTDVMLAASKTLGQIERVGEAAFGESFLDKEVPAAI